jgi:hypothetical protein
MRVGQMGALIRLQLGCVGALALGVAATIATVRVKGK